MVLRIEVIGMSVYDAPAAAGAAPAAPDGAAFFTSSSVIFPPAPDPLTAARLIPRSRASLTAAMLALGCLSKLD